MSTQHTSLAAGRWSSFSLVEQMAHIGGEVERALMWKERQNSEYSRLALDRALELLDFSLDDPKNRTRTRELARLREALVDSFVGSNLMGSSDNLWRSYFGAFVVSARRHC